MFDCRYRYLYVCVSLYLRGSELWSLPASDCLVIIWRGHMRRLRQGSTWGSQKWFWINFKSVFFPFFPTNVLFHLMEVAYRGIPLWRLSPCSVAPAPDTSSSRPTSPPGSVSTSWNPDEVIRCKIQDFTLRISRRAFTLFEPWQGSLQKKTTNVGQRVTICILCLSISCQQGWTVHNTDVAFLIMCSQFQQVDIFIPILLIASGGATSISDGIISFKHSS